jgi:hypothetical protein
MTSRATDASLADDARPPYLLALVAFLAVLGGYAVTLAPTVTFWDAGEFIATAHILGIPHPPGTPLFVLLGRFWDLLLPGVTTAFATNLMSAMFSAGSAAFLFLFVHEALRAGSAGLDAATARVFRIGGGFAATLVAAFGFTVWQNSVETEVYQVAMFSIGLIAWLMWLWRRERGGIEGAHVLLGTIYVMGVALGNHLMALLIGPAVFAFMFHVLRTDPAPQEAERNAQWAQFAVAVATWVTLVGVGVGSKGVIILGLALFLAAAVWAVLAGTWLFAVMALVVAAVGASTYLFLYVRAGLHPYINEADPSSLQNLWAVIRREQYPPRSPFDNPIYPSGPDNPGRTLQIFGLQLVNWLQYFDWQWASSLQRERTLLAPARLPFTVLFTALGIWGATEHRRWDRSSFWFLATAFATTSIGLILYLNFKPGFSIGYEWFADREAHEVRERDYFYTVSFVMWGLWAGMGIAALFRRLRERLADGPWLAAAPALLLALLPFVLNFKAASRRHGPSAYLARDFAYNMLIGIPPYGILFTNGDNDTFPLWYLQEVEAVRQDVVIVNLSLVNTDWYIRQLRDNPARPYRPDSNAVRLFGADAGPAPSCSPAQQDTVDAWAARAGRRPLDRSQGPTACLHTLNDNQINTMQPYLLPQDLPFRAGRVSRTYPAGTPLYIKDIMTLRLIQENLGRRPIYFALTAGGSARMGLERYISQEGLAFRLREDTVIPGPGLVPSRLFGTVVDVERTRTLLWEVFRYARLFDVEQLKLDTTDENIAGNLSFVYLTLGDVYAQIGDVAGAVRNYEAADHLAPNPELRRFLDQLRSETALPGLGGDSAGAGAGTPDSTKR